MENEENSLILHTKHITKLRALRMRFTSKIGVR